jgi:hypothetical protein
MYYCSVYASSNADANTSNQSDNKRNLLAYVRSFSCNNLKKYKDEILLYKSFFPIKIEWLNHLEGSSTSKGDSSDGARNVFW